MSRSSTLAITIAALSVLGMPLTAVAAPYIPESRQCYRDCTAACAAHTLQSVQGCLPDQLFSLASPAQPAAAARCDKDCTRHAEVPNSNRRPHAKSPAEAGLRQGAATD
jgi:hypothetical protein